jgi:hypothetical protein
VSEVFYLSEVCGAQGSWGKNPTMTPIDTQDMNDVVKGIGIGIGNTAVHEIGWQLAPANAQTDWLGIVEYMGCGGTNTQPCPFGDVYEQDRAGPSNYGVTNTPALQWIPENYCRLTNYLLGQPLTKPCTGQGQ